MKATILHKSLPFVYFPLTMVPNCCEFPETLNMVIINRIYTRTGDTGDTGLVGGQRIAKDDLRVEAYGDIDELNSLLGWARTLADKAGIPLTRQLATIQNELFDLGSELASPPDASYPGMILIEDSAVTRLEQWIDLATGNLPELRSFVLPGGSELNSILHVARTVCRRAERAVVRLNTREPVRPVVLHYVNRLSDYLFSQARAESHRSGVHEYLWQPGQKSA